MWGKDEKATPPVREVHHAPPPPVHVPERAPAEPVREAPLRGGGIATIGKSVMVKGQISGSEDLYIDGEVEGTVELRDNNITVGPNGRLNANVHAKDIVVLGRVKGNVRATERLEIRKSGSLVGDIITARVVIEDGAYFKGSIDIQKPGAVKEAPVAAAATASSSSPAASSTGSLPLSPPITPRVP